MNRHENHIFNMETAEMGLTTGVKCGMVME